MDSEPYIFGQVVHTPVPIDAAIPAIQQNFYTPIVPDKTDNIGSCFATDSSGVLQYAPCNIQYTENAIGYLNYEGSFYIENYGDNPIVEVRHTYDMHKQEVILNSSDFSPNSNIESNVKNYHVIRMSDDEYLKLRELEAAVEDYKDSILKKYGVNTPPNQCINSSSYSLTECATFAVYTTPPDSYEFRGQFILVNVPNAK
jgi:hypothetical protein